MTRKPTLSVPADLGDVRRIAEAARGAGHAAGLSDEAVNDLELAVVEAANNIVVHSYKNISDGFIHAFLTIEAGIIVELHDEGAAMQNNAIEQSPTVSLDAEHGRGLLIMRACLDDLSYERKGHVNVWRLVKRLPA